MAGYVNKAIIIGNLGKDPEIRKFDNGGCIANFSVATTEKWNDRNSGEKKEKTEWHNVTVRQNGSSMPSFSLMLKKATRFTSKERSKPANGSIMMAIIGTQPRSS